MANSRSRLGRVGAAWNSVCASCAGRRARIWRHAHMLTHTHKRESARVRTFVYRSCCFFLFVLFLSAYASFLSFLNFLLPMEGRPLIKLILVSVEVKRFVFRCAHTTSVDSHGSPLSVLCGLRTEFSYCSSKKSKQLSFHFSFILRVNLKKIGRFEGLNPIFKASTFEKWANFCQK